MNKGRLILYGSLVAAIAGLVIAPAILGKGSKALARKWMREFDQISSLGQAEKALPKVATLVLANGDWIAWRCLDSHGHISGGTVVTRDSDGNIRAFLGHVCGAPHVRGDTLTQVYSNLTSGTLREYKLGEED